MLHCVITFENVTSCHNIILRGIKIKIKGKMFTQNYMKKGSVYRTCRLVQVYEVDVGGVEGVTGLTLTVRCWI